MTVHLYVHDTISDWEFGYLVAELNTGRFFKEAGHRLPVRTVGATRDPIRTMGGITITPDMTLDEVQPAESSLLLLIGGNNTWTDAADRPALAKARAFLDHGVLVAGICGATIGLAAAGLLDDRPHTSGDLAALQHLAPAYRGTAHYRTDPVVDDGNGLITATGVAAPEFARAVLARLDVMSPAALDAWYLLNHTHDPGYFFTLMAALPALSSGEVVEVAADPADVPVG